MGKFDNLKMVDGSGMDSALPLAETFRVIRLNDSLDVWSVSGSRVIENSKVSSIAS